MKAQPFFSKRVLDCLAGCIYSLLATGLGRQCKWRSVTDEYRWKMLLTVTGSYTQILWCLSLLWVTLISFST